MNVEAAVLDLKQEQKKIDALQAKVTKQLGIDKKQFKTDLDRVITDIKSKSENPLSEEQVLARAGSYLRVQYKSQLRSPATSFEGIVIGKSAPFDMIRSQRQTALDQAKLDKDKAIAQGWIDSDGRPLDRREKLGPRDNANLGKPLPENEWITNLYGVALHEGEATMFNLTLSKKRALIPVPIGKAVAFRANIPDKQPGPGLKLNQSTVTQFTTIENSDIPSAAEVIGSPLFSDILINLGNVESTYHDTKDNPQRVHIVSGTVMSVSDPFADSGNIIMTLDDDTLDFEDPGVTVFVPEHLHESLDSGPGARVYVIGRIGESVRDGETRYFISAYGVLPADA